MNKPIDFYLKWIAFATGLALVVCTSFDIIPLNKFLGLITAVLWMTIGFMWDEPSMYLVNIVFTVIYSVGIIKYYM